MDLNQRFTIPAPIADVWQALIHLESIAACWPGALLSDVDGDTFAGSLKVKFGATPLVYNGSGRFIVRDDQAKRAVIEAHGDDSRGHGRASATVTVHLTSQDAATAIDVATVLQLTGSPAQLSPAVIVDVSDRVLHQFVGCVSLKLGVTGFVSPESVSTAIGASDSTRPDSTGPDSTGAQGLSGLGRAQAATPLLVRRYALPTLAGLTVLLASLSLIKRLRTDRRLRRRSPGRRPRGA